MLPGARLLRSFSVVVAASIVLSACQAPTPTPAATSAPAATTVAPPSASAASPVPSPAVQPAASPVPSPSPVPGANLTGTIKIVSSLPRTGYWQEESESLVKAIRMALSEANMKVGNATLVYEDLDDATAAKGSWDAAREAENATKAAADPDVMAYIGPFNSQAAMVSIPILCKANLLMISPVNTYPGLTRSVPGVSPDEPGVYYPGCTHNYTRVIPSDDAQTAAAISWLKRSGATGVYLLDDGQDFWKGMGQIAKTTADKVDLKVVGDPESIDIQAANYTALATKIKASGADAVYFAGVTASNAGRLWLDLRAGLGPDVQLVGTDGIYESAFLAATGNASENTFVTFGGVLPSKLTGKGSDWYQAYRRINDSEPGTYAGYAYEATKVALDAMLRAGRKDRAAVRDAMFATRDYNGILGTWSMTATGDTSLTAVSGRFIQSGKFDEPDAITIQAPR